MQAVAATSRTGACSEDPDEQQHDENDESDGPESDVHAPCFPPGTPGETCRGESDAWIGHRRDASQRRLEIGDDRQCLVETNELEEATGRRADRHDDEHRPIVGAEPLGDPREHGETGAVEVGEVRQVDREGAVSCARKDLLLDGSGVGEVDLAVEDGEHGAVASLVLHARERLGKILRVLRFHPTTSARRHIWPGQVVGPENADRALGYGCHILPAACHRGTDRAAPADVSVQPPRRRVDSASARAGQSAGSLDDAVIPAQQREDDRHGLRVAIANENQKRLDVVAGVVTEAGHDVVVRLVDLARTGATIAEQQPDVAIVAPGRDPRHALELVAEIVDEGICPVILMLESNDPALVAEAAELGVFGQLTGTEAGELQGELEIVLRRYDDYRRLEEAFERRAVVERAKGIVMERHGMDERQAFELLRGQARRSGARLVAVAQAVLEARELLPEHGRVTNDADS